MQQQQHAPATSAPRRIAALRSRTTTTADNKGDAIENKVGSASSPLRTSPPRRGRHRYYAFGCRTVVCAVVAVSAAAYYHRATSHNARGFSGAPSSSSPSSSGGEIESQQLTVVEDGLSPWADECRHLRALFRDVPRIIVGTDETADQRRGGDLSVGSRTGASQVGEPDSRPPRRGVNFLHIPKVAGGTIEKFFGGKWPRERSHPNTTRGNNCSNPDPRHRSPACRCSFWHVPPRYLTPNPYRNGVPTFCIVREPLDRALSEFKMAYRNWEGVLGNPIREIAEAIHWLRNVFPTKAEREPGFSDCHVLPQHLYVWDDDGNRTCDHVLHYEDGDLMENVGAIRRLYGDASGSVATARRRMGLATGGRKSHHPPTNLSARDIPADVASLVRRYYWRDMCLLGYAADGTRLGGQGGGPSSLKDGATGHTSEQ